MNTIQEISKRIKNLEPVVKKEEESFRPLGIFEEEEEHREKISEMLQRIRFGGNKNERLSELQKFILSKAYFLEVRRIHQNFEIRGNLRTSDILKDYYNTNPEIKHRTAVSTSISSLIKKGMLLELSVEEYRSRNYHMKEYFLTDKGRFIIKNILNQPPYN